MNFSSFVLPMTLGTGGAILFFGDIKDTQRLKSLTMERISNFRDKRGVRSKLKAIGREASYEQFRITQLAQSFCGAFFALVLMSTIQNSFLTLALIASLAGYAVYILEDRRLTTLVKNHKLMIEAEFAGIIEMLTLAISAGDTPMSALTRIAQRSEGLFSQQLSMVVQAVREGKPFQVALDDMARRIDSIQIRRFIDALVTSMSRGAPLIDLLHSHVAEARTVQKNLTMDKAGKAEMSMMIPVVFLILPISILFALWPSLMHLNLFAS